MKPRWWTVEQHDSIAVATFTRPPRNFMSFAAIGELEVLLGDLAGRDDVNVVVLTGGVPGYSSPTPTSTTSPASDEASPSTATRGRGVAP